MQLTAVILAAFTLLVALVLLLRKPSMPEQDPRLAQLPDQLTRLEARAQASDEQARNAFAQMRSDIAAEAQRSREASASDFTALRTEITGSIATLGTTLQNGLTSFREDNKTSGDQLRGSIQQQLDALTQRLTSFTSETTRSQTEVRESLNTKLTDLMSSNASHQNQLRATVEERLNQINATNAEKLEQMRVTVDEKLQSTLQTRLTESFGTVSDQLMKVHTGLGEMTKLSAGIDDLSRIFTNVKTRGTVGEVMLETLLKQMLAANQYTPNARVKPNTQEMVEFAVKLPTPEGELLLPIDSKFPREIWEKLQSAYESGTDVVAAGKTFETAIRNEGRKICDKYIAPPVTTSFAIMFLPSEALYAEVMRRDGLQADIQQNCRVTIAGPSTLAAILNSFQMGFHMLKLQQKGDEVWKTLGAAKAEFEKFGGLMDKVKKQVGTVQNTLDEIGGKTKTINRALKDVTSGESGPQPDLQTNLIGFAEGNGVVPLLAASGDEE